MINHPLVQLLKRAHTELQTFKDDAICDHSVGICWCEYIRTMEDIEQKLKRWQ